MKLTAQAIEKFENSPIKVRTINGTYKEASIQFAHSTGGFSLRVERTHPKMQEIRGSKDKNTFGVYSTRSMYSGVCQEVPKELSHVVQKLYAQAETSDAEAEKLFKDLTAAYEHAMRELGMIA